MKEIDYEYGNGSMNQQEFIDKLSILIGEYIEKRRELICQYYGIDKNDPDYKAYMEDLDIYVGDCFDGFYAEI